MNFSDLYYYDFGESDKNKDTLYFQPVAEPYIGMHAAEFAIFVGEIVETGIGWLLAWRSMNKLLKRVKTDDKRFTFVTRWNEYEKTVYWLIAYTSKKVPLPLRRLAKEVLGILLLNLPYDMKDSPDDLNVAMDLCTAISREVADLEKEAVGCLVAFWGVQYAPKFVVDGQTPYLSDKTFHDVVIPMLKLDIEKFHNMFSLAIPQLFTTCWLMCRWTPLATSLTGNRMSAYRNAIYEEVKALAAEPGPVPKSATASAPNLGKPKSRRAFLIPFRGGMNARTL